MQIRPWESCEAAEREPGTFQRSLITPEDGVASFRMFMWEVEPGKSTRAHSHPAEHGAIVLAGSGVFVSGTTETPVAKDDVFCIVADEDHQFVNTGDETLRYVFFTQLFA